MYRGSAADFLVVLCKPGNPTTNNAAEGDYTHLDSFLWLSSMKKVVLFRGCSSRGWGGPLIKTAVSEAISGSRAVHTCCCSYCSMAGDLVRADQAQLSKTLPQERYQSLEPLSAVLTMCYANAHPVIGQSTCTELARGPWVTGGV